MRDKLLTAIAVLLLALISTAVVLALIAFAMWQIPPLAYARQFFVAMLVFWSVLGVIYHAIKKDMARARRVNGVDP